MKGLIFIPDISGFTNFVKSIDSNLGVSITRDLLNGIIENNPLDLSLSEIEGDAVLYYKIGNPIPIQQVINGFQKMHEAFDTRFNKWKLQYKINADLSLKLIVHYGDIIIYDIKGFQKLYGETVIESHTLLKNDATTRDYVLITEDYMNALYEDISTTLSGCEQYPFNRSQICSGVKQIAYYFFSTIKKASTLSGMFKRNPSFNQNEMLLAVGT